jgi:hypothetical protein
MDAIAYQAPIIGLKIKSLENLFNTHHCAPGYLFDNFDAMSNGVTRIVDEHNFNYNDLVDCIK